MTRATLDQALATVRTRIGRAGSKGLNEQNTKASLIEPVLRALGWDTEDVEEVAREYRLKSRDKPVDYALLVNREPCLFVEAKGLGESLDDRRWANQIMGYAVVVGVRWVLLTNGDEYRIYNTHESVRIEEKLLRAVRATEDTPIAADTLALLSKDQLQENRIDGLWRAYFVDRQVQAALERLFSQDQDMVLVNHLVQRTKGLDADEVRSSLRRCRLQLDFPVALETVQPKKGHAKAKVGARRTPTFFNIEPRQLIEAGVLHAPVPLMCKYKGREFVAQIEPDGSVVFGRQSFDSLSTAAGAARATVIGRRPDGHFPQTNGWEFWKYRAADGDVREIDHARQEFLKRHRGPANETRHTAG